MYLKIINFIKSLEHETDIYNLIYCMDFLQVLLTELQSNGYDVSTVVQSKEFIEFDERTNKIEFNKNDLQSQYRKIPLIHNFIADFQKFIIRTSNQIDIIQIIAILSAILINKNIPLTLSDLMNNETKLQMLTDMVLVTDFTKEQKEAIKDRFKEIKFDNNLKEIGILTKIALKLTEEYEVFISQRININFVPIISKRISDIEFMKYNVQKIIKKLSI